MQIRLNPTGSTLSAGDKALVSKAFTASCEVLSANGDSRFQGRQGYYARETVARLVVGFANAGEKDPMLLSRAVISQMNAL